MSKKDLGRKILNSKVVTTRDDHFCYGGGRKFVRGASMSSASCRINGTISRKYFCESCQHTITKNALDISDFYYGELLLKSITYEKSKDNILWLYF